MASRSWSTDQLTDFLELVSGSPDEASALRAACERAAEALDAEVAAVVSGDGVRASVGFPRGNVPERELVAAAEGRAETIGVPQVGPCLASTVPLELEPPLSLLIARSGAQPLTAQEQSVLQGMGTALTLAVRMLRGLNQERNLRERSEEEARDRRTAEANYKNLVERLPAIVYQAEMGERGRWLYVAPQIEEILGFTPEEWLDDPGLWARQLHPDDREKALAQEDEAMLGDRDPPPIDYRMLTRDGRVVWILDEAVLEREDDGPPTWHGVLYDITDRKQSEVDLQRQTAQQAAVAQLGETALKGVPPEGLMKATVSVIVEVEAIELSCIWELRSDEGTVHLRAQTPIQQPGQETVMMSGPGSPAGSALESGQPVVVDDWELERRLRMPAALRERGIRSSLAVIVEGQERPFGVLEAHSTTASRFTDKDTHFVQAAANVLADAIQRRTADEAIRHRALHDPLTGLPNRQLFVERINHAIARGSRHSARLAVLFLDLDHFKLINDSLGHHTGDELLRAVAPRLTQHLRPGDTVARFGGDEFAILVEELTGPEEAMAVAGRVLDALRSPFTVRGVEHVVSGSVGIACGVAGKVDAEELIRDADAAMYRAKERGRARAEMFDEAMRARAVERLEVERELRRAIEREELVLHYQPIVGISSGQIVGVEALVRWAHPRRGLIDPSEFIPVAEETGLIDPIGRWVQQVACAQTLAWHRLRPDARPLEVAVNLSPRQVTNRDLAASVREVLDLTGLDPVYLSLEITESALVEESGPVTQTLRSLDELGVRLVLDDFGTGYSSLGYLNRFPLDALKIDRTFVQALGEEGERSAIVSAIIGMARAMSLRVIAEGVENDLQLNELRRLGCEYAQGYFFNQPLTAPQLTEVLQHGGVARAPAPGQLRGGVQPVAAPAYPPPPNHPRQ